MDDENAETPVGKRALNRKPEKISIATLINRELRFGCFTITNGTSGAVRLWCGDIISMPWKYWIRKFLGRRVAKLVSPTRLKLIFSVYCLILCGS